MEIIYKDNKYDLNIEMTSEDSTDRDTYYGDTTVKFDIQNIFIKENITEINVIRNQTSKELEIYDEDDNCGIYSIKMTAKAIIKLDNKYIDEAINRGGEYNINDDITVQIIHEEFSNIEHKSGYKFTDDEIESYLQSDEVYDAILLTVK